MAICLKDEHFNFNETKRKSTLLLAKTKFYHPIDKYFRVNKKHDKNSFTKKDMVYFNNKHLKMTNSLIFYFNHYYQKTPFFKFSTILKHTLPHSVRKINKNKKFNF